MLEEKHFRGLNGWSQRLLRGELIPVKLVEHFTYPDSTEYWQNHLLFLENDKEIEVRVKARKYDSYLSREPRGGLIELFRFTLRYPDGSELKLQSQQQRKSSSFELQVLVNRDRSQVITDSMHDCIPTVVESIERFTNARFDQCNQTLACKTYFGKDPDELWEEFVSLAPFTEEEVFYLSGLPEFWEPKQTSFRLFDSYIKQLEELLNNK